VSSNLTPSARIECQRTPANEKTQQNKQFLFAGGLYFSAQIRHSLVSFYVSLADNMAEMIKRTQADVAALNTLGKYRFGPNLQLQVSGPTAKSWLFRYSVGGNARWKGLGSARDVTLAQARKLADELRVTKTAKNIDPLGEDEAASERARAAKTKAVPFRERAEQYLTAHEATWRNAKHRAQWRSTLEAYAYPIIGDVPANAISANNIVDILRPIWAEKFDTARKVRGRIEAVLDYAADPDDPLYRNPAAMTAQLLKKLPKLPKGRRQHHPSLPYDQMAEFISALRERDGVAAHALEFTILTAARTGEVLGACWDEIDRKNGVWTVPAARMKGGREHRVPLGRAALDVLDRAKPARKGSVIFPSLPHDRSLSSMALLNVLKRLGRPDITVHGFRATFRTWAAEQTNFPREVAEAALAHVLADETEAAYQRGDLFEKRRKLMEAWAGYCDKRISGNVLPLAAPARDTAG
jgi:integrase